MDHLLRWLKHTNLSLLILFAVFWVPIIIFFKIAGEIIEKEPMAMDLSLLSWIHSHANPFLDGFFLTFTNIGGLIGIVTITLLIVTYLLYKKQRKNALLLISGVAGASAANLILKALFQRDRPSLFDSSVIETSFSFPSGHAMASAALVLSLILIFWHTKWRWIVATSGAFLVSAIGVSRLYFGVHYPSDVLAGWCASAAWVMVVFFTIRKLRSRLIRPDAPNDPL